MAILLGLGLLIPQLANAASFDCGRAVTSIERAICSRQELNELDTRLGEIFRKALSLQVDQGPLLRDQRAWLSNRERACGPLGSGGLEQCLLEKSTARIAILASIVSRGGSLSSPNTNDVWASVPTGFEAAKVNSAPTPVIAPANLPPPSKDPVVKSPTPPAPDDIQVTTADKINATLEVITSPRFFLTIAFVGLLFWGEARAKRTAQSIPTKLGRLGLVLHWASLVIAVMLFGAAGLVATQAKHFDDGAVLGGAALGILALVIWLVGKALRYILTAPAEAIQSASASVSVAPRKTQQAGKDAMFGLGRKLKYLREAFTAGATNTGNIIATVNGRLVLNWHGTASQRDGILEMLPRMRDKMMPDVEMGTFADGLIASIHDEGMSSDSTGSNIQTMAMLWRVFTTRLKDITYGDLINHANMHCAFQLHEQPGDQFKITWKISVMEGRTP
ncbi:lysozyme inhibitor LprI family protein [Bradyrhizobium sp. JR4.1]|uniref:lysozyme inhibitor LprI family protein n=1 Tax=Bradyrhizobium sp. JR4.1 TaxID=3156372 RepID=UPI003397850E